MIDMEDASGAQIRREGYISVYSTPPFLVEYLTLFNKAILRQQEWLIMKIITWNYFHSVKRGLKSLGDVDRYFPNQNIILNPFLTLILGNFS